MWARKYLKAKRSDSGHIAQCHGRQARYRMAWLHNFIDHERRHANDALDVSHTVGARAVYGVRRTEPTVRGGRLVQPQGLHIDPEFGPLKL